MPGDPTRGLTLAGNGFILIVTVRGEDGWADYGEEFWINKLLSPTVLSIDVQKSFSQPFWAGIRKLGDFPYFFIPQSPNPGENFSGGLYVHFDGGKMSLRDEAIQTLREMAIEPPDPVSGDVGHLSEQEATAQGLGFIPRSLPEALNALEADPVIGEALGPAILPEFLKVKRAELAAYEVPVHPWERATYLEVI